MGQAMSRKPARPSGPVRAAGPVRTVTNIMAERTLDMARTAATYAQRQFEAAWNDGRPSAVLLRIYITRVEERRTKVVTQIVMVDRRKKTLIKDALNYLHEIEYWLIRLHALASHMGMLHGNRRVMLKHKTIATKMFKRKYGLKNTKVHVDKRNEIRRLINA